MNGEKKRMSTRQSAISGASNLPSSSATATLTCHSEQNELVHSMRSVLDALPGRLRTFHLILADYPFNYPEDLELVPSSIIPELEKVVSKSKSRRHPRDLPGTPPSFSNLTKRVTPESISASLASHLQSEWRIVQTPTWLDFSRRDPSDPSHPFHPYSVSKAGERGQHYAEASYPTLRYASHWEVFHIPSVDRDGRQELMGEREWRENEWKKKALPTFNSMAIESRIGWLPGLVRQSHCTLQLIRTDEPVGRRYHCIER